MHPSVEFVCDMCSTATPATEHLRLTWRGKHYRLDLCPRHEKEVSRSLTKWLAGVTPRASREAENTTAGGYNPKAVREWARRRKIPLPERGRIPKDVVERYLKSVSS